LVVPVAAGEIFDRRTALVSDDSRQRLVDIIAESSALIYLFDPSGEVLEALHYFDGLITELRHRVLQSGTTGSGSTYLPQRIVVCVAKFDLPEVYDIAKRAGLLTVSRDGIPTVQSGESARLLFEALCTAMGPAAEVFAQLLRANFAPANIDYTVVTAIGFRAVDGRFDTRDPPLYPSGVPVLRDTITPLGVLETVAAAERLISEGRRA
jgi:hypothetical protein